MTSIDKLIMHFRINITPKDDEAEIARGYLLLTLINMVIGNRNE
jgi:hypothetical protein